MTNLAEMNNSLRTAVAERTKEKPVLTSRLYYIAGPMTNQPQCNQGAFDGAKAMVQSMGHAAVTPVDLDRRHGHDWSDSDGSVESLEKQGFCRSAATLRNTNAIIAADGIVLLPGWRASKGSLQEKALAESLDLEVLELETWAAPREERAPTQQPSRTENPKDTIGATKAPISTIPANVISEVGVAMLSGACKYGRHNWRTSKVRASVYYDAMWRHMAAWWEGEDVDSESNEHHLTHLIACAIIMRDAMARDMVEDDRPPRSPGGWKALANMHAKEVVEKFPNPLPAHTEV